MASIRCQEAGNYFCLANLVNGDFVSPTQRKLLEASLHKRNGQALLALLNVAKNALLSVTGIHCQEKRWILYIIGRSRHFLTILRGGRGEADSSLVMQRGGGRGSRLFCKWKEGQWNFWGVEKGGLSFFVALKNGGEYYFWSLKCGARPSFEVGKAPHLSTAVQCTGAGETDKP